MAKTIRDIQAEKNNKDISEITIQNISKQMVPINLRAPKNIDFYAGSTDIRVNPGKIVTIRKSRLWMEQIDRLKTQGFLSIISSKN